MLAFTRQAGAGTLYYTAHLNVTLPVEDIQRLLAERPDDRGLAAPGMPIGSPGMPGPARPYTVYLIGKDGSSTPYSQHGH